MRMMAPSVRLNSGVRLEDHFAQPRHYFSYGGRLKRELMIKIQPAGGQDSAEFHGV